MDRRRPVWPIFTLLFVIGTGRAFSGPASSALVPHLVPQEHFVNAITWGSAIFQFSNIVGPALGGVLFTLPLRGDCTEQRWCICHAGRARGVPGAGGIAACAPGKDGTPGDFKRVILAGFRYVAKTQVLLGSISLDLFAVLLGGAVALMPIFAQDILHAGPRGLGMLRAAPALGALAVSLWLMVRPIQRRAGKRMLVCVAIFGAATLFFGVSKSLPVSLAALFIVGASDMVSVVIRSSVLQLATPPEMRGRVSAVNSLFVGASNELGEFESGLTAQWWGAVRAVVVGGVGSLLITGLWAVFFPSLRRADALTPEALLAAEQEQSGREVRQL